MVLIKQDPVHFSHSLRFQEDTSDDNSTEPLRHSMLFAMYIRNFGCFQCRFQEQEYCFLIALIPDYCLPISFLGIVYICNSFMYIFGFEARLRILMELVPVLFSHILCFKEENSDDNSKGPLKYSTSTEENE